MHAAGRATKSQNNPFGRLNSGRAGGQSWWPGGWVGGGGQLFQGITSEGQHCPHVFHPIASKSSLYMKLKFRLQLSGLSSDFQMRR